MRAPSQIAAPVSSVWVQNPRWTREPGLAHGSLTRQESVTEGKLPTSQSVGRAKPYVDRLLAEATLIGGESAIQSARIIGGDQVHGDRIAVVQRPEDLQGARRLTEAGERAYEIHEFPETDGFITTLPNVLLVIQTADCLPILYWDPASRMIGACHCGWRGLYANLAQKTAEAMVSLGALRESLQAWIGPGIRAENYEVGRELVEKFRARFPVAAASPDGTHLDLARVAIEQLERAGLHDTRITDSGECTLANPTRYHSYRRDGPGAGRLLTVIAMLNDEMLTE